MPLVPAPATLGTEQSNREEAGSCPPVNAGAWWGAPTGTSEEDCGNQRWGGRSVLVRAAEGEAGASQRRRYTDLVLKAENEPCGRTKHSRETSWGDKGFGNFTNQKRLGQSEPGESRGGRQQTLHHLHHQGSESSLWRAQGTAGFGAGEWQDVIKPRCFTFIACLLLPTITWDGNHYYPYLTGRNKHREGSDLPKFTPLERLSQDWRGNMSHKTAKVRQSRATL